MNMIKKKYSANPTKFLIIVFYGCNPPNQILRHKTRDIVFAFIRGHIAVMKVEEIA